MADQGPLRVVVDDGDTDTILVDQETGTVTEMQGDGGVVVHLDAKAGFGAKDEDEEWFANLIDKVGDIRLSTITNDLIDGIKADDQSRQGYLANTDRGMDLLGLQLKSPSTSVESTGDGPVMSKVTNPLLLEAVLKGWANAEAELLPANGPCKIKSDGQETVQEDDDAETLERGVNHFLTVTASEYYPQTSHMLLWGTYFRGSGFKKVYRCPRRRRPVSEKVDTKDLIVSDTSTDLRSCGRITHEIEMRPSVFKLMQLIGAYRKTSGAQPNPEPNQVDSKIATIQGTEPVPSRPEDKPYTIWETQCELDLDEFIPDDSKFKGQGIPLPYLVSIDKDNEEILSIRRDWMEDDPWCSRIRMYVRYPYVPGPGFYGTGMLNILGNASAAMTAAWREALDAGMFASFPGGFIDKRAVRGNQGGNANTTFQLGPGEFVPVDTGSGKLSDMVVPQPYRDVTPGLMTMMDKITEQSKGLGGAAEVPVSEGVQNVPVGSMLAAIEQATKVMAAAHKGQHNAQSEELQILIDLFRRHPEDLTKSDKLSPFYGWDEQKLVEALENHKLVPVSDPNVPSHIHRIAKALALIQLKSVFPGKMDEDAILKRCLAAIKEDPEGLIPKVPNPAPPPPLKDQADMIEAQSKAKKVDADIAGKATEDSLKQRELQTDLATRQMDLEKERVIHAADAEKAQLDAAKVGGDIMGKQHEVAQAEVDSRRKTGVELVKAGLGAHRDHMDHQLGMAQHVQQVHRDTQDHHAELASHVLEANRSAHQAMLDTHEAMQPRETKQRARGGAVTEDGDGGMGILAKAIESLVHGLRGQQSAMKDMIRQMTAPKKVVRGDDGKISHLQTIEQANDAIDHPEEPLHVIVEGNDDT